MMHRITGRSRRPDLTDNLVARSARWMKRSNPRNTELRGITWANNTIGFVTVGDARGSGAYIATSGDSITWTDRANPSNLDLNAVVFAPSVPNLCAVGSPDGTDAYIVTSPDGVNWTERANPKAVSLADVAWSPLHTTLAAVGANDGTDAYLVTSANDGVTWTERSNPASGLQAVQWSPLLSMFCAVGNSSAIITSPNGSVWTSALSVPSSGNLGALLWVPHLKLFVAGSGLGEIITTPDPTGTWELAYTASRAIYDFATDGRHVIATGSQIMLISSDCRRWRVMRHNLPTADLNDIAYGRGIFAAVGDPDGTEAYIFTVKKSQLTRLRGRTRVM